MHHLSSTVRLVPHCTPLPRPAHITGQKLNLFIPPSPIPPPVGSPTKLSLSTLLASGAALGHATSALAPAYMPYVYGNRSGLSVIDLDQTLPLLRRAANLVREVVAADGVVMIVGTREGHAKFLRKAHERMEDNAYTVGEWLPGTLTNSATLYVTYPFDRLLLRTGGRIRLCPVVSEPLPLPALAVCLRSSTSCAAQSRGLIKSYIEGYI